MLINTLSRRFIASSLRAKAVTSSVPRVVSVGAAARWQTTSVTVCSVVFLLLSIVKSVHSIFLTHLLNLLCSIRVDKRRKVCQNIIVFFV